MLEGLLIYCGGTILSFIACMWLWEINLSLKNSSKTKEQTFKGFLFALLNVIIFIIVIYQTLVVARKIIILLCFIFQMCNVHYIVDVIRSKEPNEVQMYMAKIALWIVNLI